MVEQERVMLKRIAIMLIAATALGFAVPANAQYGGGWWGSPYHRYHDRIYNYYPRHHFFVRHHFHRSWWGGY